MLQNLGLLSTVLIMLGGATWGGQWLKRQDSPGIDRKLVEAFNARIAAWWFFTIVIAAAFVLPGVTVLMFALMSFWALREFVTLTPTRISDHRALFWVFLFFTPAQFALVYCSRWWDTYGLYSILIPLYGFLFVSVRSAAAGDFDRFLERVAKVLYALMICVYCLSFAPALLYLKCRDSSGADAAPRLLFFFVTIALSSDLLQWAWSRVYGRHVIAPKIDPDLSWEGVLAGAGSAAVLGLLLAWAAPFGAWWQTATMSALIAVMAAAGSITISAIKRDRGELTTGNFVEGHSGVLSHIDAICFAAPVFYHVSRYFFGVK